MSFGSPWALLLLLPVWLLLGRRWLVSRNLMAVPRLADVQSKTTIRLLLAWLPGALQLVGLTLLVVALARPQIVRTDVMIESEGLDIVLAVDTSLSMREEDFTAGGMKANRLEVAKAVMADFVEGRPHDRIGVVVFGEEAFTHVPLTLDHDSLVSFLDTVQLSVAGGQGTAIGSAIAVSAKRLKDLDAPDRIMILLTDGRNNAGSIHPMEAAQAAAALDIKVYTIGVGSERSGGIRFLGSNGPDERMLTAISQATDARYFRARDSRSLVKIYETIDELEPSTAEVIQLIDEEELFRWFLAPGLGFLGLGWLLAGTWLRRGP